MSEAIIKIKVEGMQDLEKVRDLLAEVRDLLQEIADLRVNASPPPG